MPSRMVRAIEKGATAWTVYRSASPGYDANGRLQTPSESTETIYMWEQPMSASDLQKLPEGYRNQNVKKFYALDEVFDGSVDSDQDADEILLDGKRWEVIKVWDWERDGGYWKVHAVRKGQG